MHNAILVKTDRGQQAVRDRDSCPELTGRLRTLLLQVDGQKTGAALAALAGPLGVPADGIERLLALGLIARPAAPVADVPDSESDDPPVELIEAAPPPLSEDTLVRLHQAKQLMNQAAGEYLGLKAMFFTRKVEQCTHPEALRPLLDQLRQGIAKAKNPVRAELVLHDIVVLLEHNI
ncbi:hypothetical protein [Chitinimonas lacunae]|uniref:Uncharacterized protein n=1 Tax=Chitinimonas lacunae TaxID=1963018 RepID=A0ABV8ML92_9NEIS